MFMTSQNQACKTDTDFDLCGALTRVLGHVDDAEGRARRVQGSLHHGLRGTHERVDRPVGGRPRIHVQQAAALRGRDGISDGVDHLDSGTVESAGHSRS